MKRILTTVLVLASLFMFGLGSKPESGITATVASTSSTAACEDKDLTCGEPFKDSDGLWYQWCQCATNGLLIRRPVF